MTICFTGKGSSGSWKIRGQQLSEAMNLPCFPAPNNEVNGFDKVIIVKKFTNNTNGGKTRIWDVVDYWPQPIGNEWSRDKLIAHIQNTAQLQRIDYVIAATEKMREDIGADFTLYHHCRPGLKKNPVREHITTLGYEGSPKYLGKWLRFLLQYCKENQYDFVINPPDLSEVDVLVAFRDLPHKGYATDNWKSNVKLANAQGSGTPIICNREAGYLENSGHGEMFADTPEEFLNCMKTLQHQGERLIRSQSLYNIKYTVQQCADDYLKFLNNV